MRHCFFARDHSRYAQQQGSAMFHMKVLSLQGLRSMALYADGWKHAAHTSGATESPPILEKKRPRPDALGGLFWLCTAEVRLSPDAPPPPASGGVACAGSADVVLLGLGCGVLSKRTMGRLACACMHNICHQVAIHAIFSMPHEATPLLHEQIKSTT